VDPGANTPSLIAFALESSGSRQRVGVVRADGTEQRFVTDGSAEASMPAWSPDGTELVMSYQGIAGRNPQLWAIGVNGTGLRAVPIGDRAGRSPSWSPNGQQVAFDDFHGLFLVKPDGSGFRALLTDEYDNGVPQWSPDGNWILFTGFEPGFGEGSSRRLYVVRPDGSGLRRLASSVNRAILKASWSPDGTRIVFDVNDGDLRIVTVSTDAVTTLTNTPELESRPAWSPDGTRIAFKRMVGAGSHIFTVRVDGTDERQVTSGAGYYDQPSWQPLAARSR
jgi:Tol biopolymer transport system component